MSNADEVITALRIELEQLRAANAAREVDVLSALDAAQASVGDLSARLAAAEMERDAERKAHEATTARLRKFDDCVPVEAANTTLRLRDAHHAQDLKELNDALAAERKAHEETKAQMARYTTALRKIDGIRNSIVGMQGFNFSEHAYPLVAALGEAGFEGDGYVLSAKNLGTLIEQRNAAERERDEARTQSADLAKQLEEMRAINLGQVKSFRAQRDALTKQVKALAEERDGYKETAARIWSLREYALEHNGPSEMECGHPDNLLDRSVESGTVFCAGCRNAEMLRDALHMEQTHKAERDSLRERLGDAERVIEAARALLPDAEAWRQGCRGIITTPLLAMRSALAEFDARKR